MPDFTRKPNRSFTTSVRLTEEEKMLLESLVEPLKVRGQSDVLRIALDYFLAHSAEGKAAVKASLGK